MPSFFQFPVLSSFPELTHFISTRNGGASHFPYESLNIGLAVGDEPEKVMENRKRVAENAGFSIQTGILPQLTHGNHVAVVGKADAGKGFAYPEKIVTDTDALITQDCGILLIVTLADCTPIFLYDPEHKAIGIAHSGWKGTIGKITTKILTAMTHHYGTNPQRVRAAIGVTIGGCCYEVSESLAALFEQAFGASVVSRNANSLPHLSLTEANRIQLIQAGIPETQIETTDTCTACNVHRFFSHRKENEITGRFCAGIGLNERG